MTYEEYQQLSWYEKAIVNGFSKEELQAIFSGDYNPYEW